MKRVGNLYEQILDIENLKLAHKNARKGKTWYKQVKQIDNELHYYLKTLQRTLKDERYKTSNYEIFQIWDKNKYRVIYKLPYYPDRICQWAIIQVIQPYLLKSLTNDSYSAIPNRGIHLALKRLKYDMVNDVENTKYCLKMDVSKYYPSINQSILSNKLRTIFKDEKLLNLLDEIIHSTNSGIPIGNYLSQWFGNFYLGEFAHWLKEVKKVKHLYIYMDDIVILDSNKQFLHQLKRDIDEYMHKKLKLKIKNNWQVFPSNTRGIDFVGYRTFKGYTLLRKSTYKNIRIKSNKIKRKIKNNIHLNYNDYCSINSYKGWLKYCNSYNLKTKYIFPLKIGLDTYYVNNIKRR